MISHYYRWNGGAFTTDPKFPNGPPFQGQVLVDGVRCTLPVFEMVTGSEGWILYRDDASDGRMQFTPSGKNFRTKRLFGRVEFIPPGEADVPMIKEAA